MSEDSRSLTRNEKVDRLKDSPYFSEFKENKENKTNKSKSKSNEARADNQTNNDSNDFMENELLTRPYIFLGDDGKYKLNHPGFIDYFRKNIKPLIIKNGAYEDSHFYIYKNGFYRLYDINMLKRYIEKMLPHDLRKPRLINPLSEHLNYADEFKSYEDCNPENYINFKNGLYNLDTGKIEPHTPDILTTIQLPVKFDSEADYSKYKNGAFDTFINHHLGGDQSQIQLIMEFFGLVLSNIPAHRYKKALLVVGDGDTGKSQLRKLIELLIGGKNFYSTKLDKLENNRFEVANLYNKRLSGDSDMSFMAVKELSIFKTLTGGDSIGAEFKSRNGFNFTFNGLLWFCANELPKFGGDKGDHVYNRFCVVRSVGKTHKKGEQSKDGSVEADPRLLGKMFKEAPYIIGKALAALKVLLENQRFSETDRQSRELTDYRKKNSSAAEFFDECIVKRPADKIEDSVTKAKINKIYTLWCKENRKYPESKAELYRCIAQNGGIITVQHGYEYYKNFTVSLETKKEFKMFDSAENF